MKKVLFIYSGERTGLDRLIAEGTAPDTQLYGMNHMSSELEVRYKEFGDVPWRKTMGSILGFRLRHMLMFFRTGGYDFVYGQSLLYTAFLKRVFGSRTRYVLLNTSLNRLLNTHPKHSATYKFALWCLEGIEVVACFSQVQLDELRDVHGIPLYKLSSVPFGTDIAFHTPVYTGRKDYLLAVGRDNGRDYGTIFDVAEKMPERSFRIMASKRNIPTDRVTPSNVHIQYDVPPSDVRQAYCEAAGLLLITEPDNYAQGSDCSGQTVLLDAMASGLPIIATEKAYLKEYLSVGDELLVVPPHDADALVAAITQIAGAGERIARSARRRVEDEFSTEKFGERLSAIALKPWILYVANARIPTQKAHGVQIMHTCEALVRSGAYVELIVPHRRTDIHTDPHAYYSVEPLFPIRILFTLDVIWAGAFGYLLHEWIFIRRVKAYLRKFNSPQIVYVRAERVYLPLAQLSNHHRIFFESHIKPKTFQQRRADYLRTAGVVVVTKYYKEELEKEGFSADQVLWAPDGVDLRIFGKIQDKGAERGERGLPMNVPIVGYIGKLTTMDQEKGMGDLLQAFLELRKKQSAAFLLVVGATDEEVRDVSRQLHELGLANDSYTIVGHVPHAEALRYMELVDVLIMNYPDSAHYAYYMSPLKLFEYMASGVPIVSTDLPSVRDILNEKNAVLVPPSDPRALSEGIDHILRETTIAAALAQQALQDVTQYSWEARADTILTFIEQNL